MTSEPTVTRLGQSMPFPSCSRRFGKVHPILHPPPPAKVALSRALGVVVRDVVLTADETAGPLVSHQPAPGRVSLLEWFEGERVDTRPGIRKRAGPTLPGARMIGSCLRNRSRAGNERTPSRARLG
jgi:hypothetical protein